MKRTLTTALFLIFYLVGFAQIPAGYYDDAEGLSGDDLRMALRSIITSGQQNNDYDDLYSYYQSTDNYSNGKVWDMYSIHADGTANYWFDHVTDKCSSGYDEEGDCYNREHSVPESWMGSGGSIADADLFVVVPTDGYVNNYRSNLPYGETSTPNWTSTNGSKRGSCTYPGYTGTIFEPIEDYKGDFARAYFYVVTRYNVSDWNGDSFDGDGFSSWTLNMLLEWDSQDPVSQKEIDRNDAVYDIQHNRNPYIDHPEWVCEVFSTNCGTNVSPPKNLTATGISTSEIDLTWELNDANNDILLAYNTTNSFGIPTGDYIVGNTISGGGTVIYLGSNTALNHTSLLQQTYYYKIWSYDGTEYSAGISTMATPLMPEPSNHVTNFTTLNPSASTIDLSWTDATGTITPLGYVIKANYAGNSISAPIDGQPENEGIFTKNVSYGDQTATFEGLNPTTQYDFKIFPYSNSGVNIDYKTDGTIPQTTGTTTELSEFCGTETFSNVPSTGSSYQDFSWTSDDSGTWTASGARTDQTISGTAVCFKNYAQTDIVPNGIGELTVSTKYPFSDGTSTVSVLVNGTEVGTVPVTQSIVQTTTITNIDISGPVQIKFMSDGSKRPAIDDVVWTCYGSQAGNNEDSEILNPLSQITGSSILSTETNFVDVFSFAVEDLGTSDGLPTFLSSIKIYPNSTNTADWTDIINAVKINDGSTDINLSTITITDNYIVIPLSSLYEIMDNSSTEFTLSVQVNGNSIIDNSILAFMIDADNTGFETDNSGSGIASVINSGNDIISNNFTLDILKDEDSEILDPTSQISGNIIYSTQTNFIDVFSFKVLDLGTSDGLSTYLSSVKIYPNSSENSADWTDIINSVKLNDGTSDISISTPTITDDYITIPFNNLYEIVDNSSVEFTLSIKINGSSVVDDSELAFIIDANNNGFVTDGSGSEIASIVNSGVDIESNTFLLFFTKDTDSDILEPTTQITGSTILSTETNFVDVFSFKVQDLGTSDGLSTLLSSVEFYPSSSNTADWVSSISNIKINDGTSDIELSTPTISDDYIILPLNNLYEIANNSTAEFTLSIQINGNSVVNNSILAFMIDADNHGFEANAAGSGIITIANSGDDIISNNFTISVIDNIEELNDDSFTIFPNPNSTGIFEITSTFYNNFDVLIYDASGREINFKTDNSNIYNISDASEGIFFVRIETEDSIIWKKIIIQ
ncbi:MAG: endonuclease [Bacteroidales bacterium]|nr:endonuclease [Bacteroidales bacterium]